MTTSPNVCPNLYPQTVYVSTNFLVLWVRSVYKLTEFWRQPMEKPLKSAWIKVRVEDVEKQAFEDVAGRAGLSLSAWMRERLRLAAIRELEEAGRPIPFLKMNR